MEQSQAEEKPWIKAYRSRKPSVPVRTLISPLASRNC